MDRRHPLKNMIERRKKGGTEGVYSVCSANEYVIEASMRRALDYDAEVLIEATANQVNQYGGYTGMKPADFREFVFSIAQKSGFPSGRIILGGDHLGPLTWSGEKAETAMLKASELIRDYVLAGFTKIHIDTSMRLGDDSKVGKLDTEVVAERGAVLCRIAEAAFSELQASMPDAAHPVYVVGSEVPIPGGSREEESVNVTRAADFEETVECFRKRFTCYGLEKAWENVIAVVVQPGVEFGDNSIHDYNREAAADLCRALKKYPDMVFEGHSTDYQTPESLRKMVEDGIAILKVGPALTFAFREAVFMLNKVEEELFGGIEGFKLSRFMDTAENVMLKHPENWIKHYHGDDRSKRLSRRYSYSDRIRYYLPRPELRESLERMIGNLKSVEIPVALISQYMPVQYVKLRKGLLGREPESLIRDRIINTIDDYYYAIMPGERNVGG